MIPQDAGVDAHFEMVRSERGVAVSAFVEADTPRPLRWRLVVSSRTNGGTSNVTQGGATDGRSAAPVGVVTVSPNSQGLVTLSVYDGDRMVHEETADIAPEPRGPGES
jgi:hypothetical protein